MARQSMASMENHQIWARNLGICSQKLKSAVPLQKMQLRTKARINDIRSDRPTHEIHYDQQIHQVSPVADGLHRRVVSLLSYDCRVAQPLLLRGRETSGSAGLWSHEIGKWEGTMWMRCCAGKRVLRKARLCDHICCERGWEW